MKYLFALILLLPLIATAQTGIYYDETRDGEGITAYDDGERLVFYFYTYGGEDCDLIEGPVVSAQSCEVVTATAECPNDKQGEPLCAPVTVDQTVCVTAEADSIIKSCDLNGQRWFFGVEEWDGEDATGVLYLAEGVNYPEGVFNPDVWKGVTVGDPEVAGLYQIIWGGEEKGYHLEVIHWGDTLMPDDPIYQQPYTFNTLLFEAN